MNTTFLVPIWAVSFSILVPVLLALIYLGSQVVFLAFFRTYCARAGMRSLLNSGPRNRADHNWLPLLVRRTYRSLDLPRQVKVASGSMAHARLARHDLCGGLHMLHRAFLRLPGGIELPRCLPRCWVQIGISAMFCVPNYSPVRASNMNWTSACLGVFAIFAIGGWYGICRRTYTGPASSGHAIEEVLGGTPETEAAIENKS